MERRYYNIFVYGVIAAVIIFFIAFRFFNTSVERQLDVQMYKKAKGGALEELKATREQEIKEEQTITEDNQLAPSTIKVQKQSILMENQYYWDSNTRAILEDTDVLERMDEAGVFEGNKKTSAQFQAQIQRLDGRIREYEQKVQSDPGDDHARQKLQNLYMLKATVGGIEEAVVEE